MVSVCIVDCYFFSVEKFFININVYTNNPLILDTVNEKFAYVTEYWTWKEVLVNVIKGCILPGNVQAGGALWFLAILLQISVLYCVVDFTLRRFLNKEYILIAQFVVSVVFLVIGYFFSLSGVSLYGIATSFSCYGLFYTGLILNKFSEKVYPVKWIEAVIVCLVSTFILCVLNNFGSVGLAANNYKDPFYLFAASLAGWYMLYGLAMLIKKSEKLSSVFSYIGKNTLSIVILHFLAFKLVSLVGVLLVGDELYKIAAFPVLYVGLGWRVLYTLVGITISLVANKILKEIKKNNKGVG